MQDRFRLAVNRYRLTRELRRLPSTPQLVLGTDRFTVLSMVHHRDVAPYILAVKSFCRFLRPNRVVVVTDPTITDGDRDVIAQHVLGIEFFDAKSLRRDGIPQGGTWERLVAISQLVKDGFVVQLDADTVTVRDVPEVREAILEGRSFVIGTEDGQDFVPCGEAAARANGCTASGERVHVQALAESKLDQLPESSRLQYGRGCSGFAGFAGGSFDLASLASFSRRMRDLIGPRWDEWGTEQFASNFFVANAPHAQVLPHPKYCHPGNERSFTVFLHFIGYVRFASDRYAQLAKEVCVDLLRRNA